MSGSSSGGVSGPTLGNAGRKLLAGIGDDSVEVFWSSWLAARIRSLSHAQKVSMGLSSGEYGGRNQMRAPAPSMACFTGSILCAVRLSMTTTSPGRSWGNEHLRDESEKHLARSPGFDEAEPKDSCAGDGTQDGDDTSPVSGDFVDDHTAAGRSSTGARHGHVDTGFVDEDKATVSTSLLLREKGFASREHVRPISLGGYERLFLSVYPRRLTLRTVAERLTTKPIAMLHRTASSS